MIKKFCTKPGCIEYAMTRASRCFTHRPKPEDRQIDTRENSSVRGYGSVWQKIRKAKLAMNPICEICNRVGAGVVHHVDHDPKNNQPENLQSVCRDCHESHHGRKK